MNKIKILIADDHKIVRMGLKALISSEKDMAVVGEADDGDAAVRASVTLKPDVVIMDLMMPVKNGEDAIAELHELLPSVRTIVLTSFASSDRIVQALNAGATGAVLKTADDATLLKAIRTVSRGETFISPEIKKLISVDPPVQKLTPPPAGGSRVAHAGPEQQGHRRQARHFQSARRGAHGLSPLEDRRRQPHRGRRHCPPQAPAENTMICLLSLRVMRLHLVYA